MKSTERQVLNEDLKKQWIGENKMNKITAIVAMTTFVIGLVIVLASVVSGEINNTTNATTEVATTTTVSPMTGFFKTLMFGAVGGAIAGGSFYFRKKREEGDELDLSRLIVTVGLGAVVGLVGKYVLPQFGITMPFDDVMGIGLSMGLTLSVQLWLQGALARVVKETSTETETTSVETPKSE